MTIGFPALKHRPSLKLNSAKCLLCNQVLVSTHVHDFNGCECGNLCVDGGLEYVRRAFKDYTQVEELSQYYEDGETVPAYNPRERDGWPY